MATTSKEGSRRANYPMAIGRGSDNKYQSRQLSAAGNWNEYNLNPLTRNNWRTSLVPAPAVIPAPIAYIKFVAVKKLVVESLGGRRLGLPEGVYWLAIPIIAVWHGLSLTGWSIVAWPFTLKKSVRSMQAYCL
jgi:hypothetical protein